MIKNKTTIGSNKEKKFFKRRAFNRRRLLNFLPAASAARSIWKSRALVIAVPPETGIEPSTYLPAVREKWARRTLLNKRFVFLRRVQILRLLGKGLFGKALVNNFSLLGSSRSKLVIGGSEQPGNLVTRGSFLNDNSLKNFLSYNAVLNRLVKSAVTASKGNSVQLSYIKLLGVHKAVFNFRLSRLHYFDKTSIYKESLLRRQSRALLGLSGNFKFANKDGSEQVKIANFFKKELKVPVKEEVNSRKRELYGALNGSQKLLKNAGASPAEDLFSRWIEIRRELGSAIKKKNLVFSNKSGFLKDTTRLNWLQSNSGSELKEKYTKKAWKRATQFFMGFARMRGAFILEFKIGRKFNTLSIYTRKKKLICSRSTKGLGFKKKMRTDLLKTSYTFCRIFSIFKYYVFSKFRIKTSLASHNFMIYLKGDRVKTLKVFKYFRDRIPIKFVGIFDKGGVTHNGCRLSKRRRRKNKGKNKFSRKHIKL